MPTTIDFDHRNRQRQLGTTTNRNGPLFTALSLSVSAQTARRSEMGGSLMQHFHQRRP
jgi:hypothetical protein